MTFGSFRFLLAAISAATIFGFLQFLLARHVFMELERNGHAAGGGDTLLWVASERPCGWWRNALASYTQA
jgi:hypothetical protein